jgi:hypothetical protein
MEIKTNGHETLEHQELEIEDFQESNQDEWSEAQLAKLLDFDDTPEIPLEIVQDEDETLASDAPSGINQNTVSQSELFDDPIEGKTKPQFSSQPGPKATAVGLVMLVIFGGGGLFLNAVMGPKPRQAPSIASNPTPQPIPSVSPAPVNETGNLKTQVALGKQEEQIKALEDSRSPKTSVASITKAQKPTPQNTTSPPPPRTVVQSPPPRIVTQRQYTPSQYTSPPRRESNKPQTQAAPLPRTVPTPQTTQQPVQTPLRQPVDPMEEWMAMRKIGSYGTGNVTETASPDATNPNRTHSTQEGVKVAASVTMPRAVPVVSSVPLPTATSEDTPDEKTSSSGTGAAVVPEQEQAIATGSQAEVSSQVQQEQAIAFSPASASASNQVGQDANATINPAEEASILNGVPVRSLQVGSMAKGQLVTPVIWAGNQAGTATKPASGNALGEKFIVQVAQPLTDKDGFETLPAGTQIVAQVVGVNESGLAELEATQVVVDGKEYMLPPGAISIRGLDGQPLIASKWGDKGKAIASADMTAFLFGSLSKVGQVLNQPDVEQSINSTEFGLSQSTTSRSRRPNILGAVLEGGFGPLTEQILQRNERSLTETLSRPNVWYVRAGTSVQVFVNQSFEF